MLWAMLPGRRWKSLHENTCMSNAPLITNHLGSLPGRRCIWEGAAVPKRNPTSLSRTIVYIYIGGFPNACGSKRHTPSSNSTPQAECATTINSLKDCRSKSSVFVTPFCSTVFGRGRGMHIQYAYCPQLPRPRCGGPAKANGSAAMTGLA